MANIDEKENNGYRDLRSKIIVAAEREFADKSIIERKAYAEAAFFLMNEVHIQNHDVFAGNLKQYYHLGMYPRDMGQELDYLANTRGEGVQEYKRMLTAEEMGLFTRAPGAHVAPAYNVLVQEGVQGRIDRIRSLMHGKAGGKKHFYAAELAVLCAMQERILTYAKEAMKQYHICKKENLRRISQSCQRIAYNRPGSLFDSIQLVLLAHEHVLAEAGSGSISFGRLDQYLYPFYEKDLNENRITKTGAREMITEFWRKIAEFEMGWQNVTLGGSSSDGADQCNDLTIFCMDASLAVRADQPQLSLRVHKNMPQAVWDKALELIGAGMGFPELYHDEVAVKAKIHAGIAPEDAWDYCVVGCVELSVAGKEYSHLEGARFNWMKILELMLHGGKCPVTGFRWELAESHKLEEINSFQEFYEWYQRELKHFTRFVCRYIDDLSCQYGDYWPVPFLSSMMQGCVEKGRDVTGGGTVYHNLSVNCVGVASVADSLEAIEVLVFKEKRMSLRGLAAILAKDFEGFGPMRERMLSCPKYGNDIPSVDSKVKELTGLFVNTLSEAPRKYGKGKFQAGFYTSYFHATMGAMTGASPDGRKAGEALSGALSPMAGMDKSGPTAVVNSANKVNMEWFGNGMALDLKFNADFFKQERHRKAIRFLIEEYFDQGGLQVQVNAIDKETLLKAKKDPVKYRDIIVRVSGFSAYFVALEENLQDEIIRRTEHKVS